MSRRGLNEAPIFPEGRTRGNQTTTRHVLTVARRIVAARVVVGFIRRSGRTRGASVIQDVLILGAEFLYPA